MSHFPCYAYSFLESKTNTLCMFSPGELTVNVNTYAFNKFLISSFSSPRCISRSLFWILFMLQNIKVDFLTLIVNSFECIIKINFQGIQIFSGVENACFVCKEIKFELWRGNLNVIDIKWYGKTRVTSCELQVTSYRLKA